MGVTLVDVSDIMYYDQSRKLIWFRRNAMTELQQLIAKYTMQEIVTELYRDVDCALTLHREIGDISARIAAEQMKVFTKQVFDEITTEAEVHNHYCEAVVLALLGLTSAALTKREINEIKTEIIGHIRKTH